MRGVLHVFSVVESWHRSSTWSSVVYVSEPLDIYFIWRMQARSFIGIVPDGLEFGRESDLLNYCKT